MNALAWGVVAAVVMVLVAILLFRRRETADIFETFPSREAAWSYAQKQDEAGYHVSIRVRGWIWEVRCWRREASERGNEIRSRNFRPADGTGTPAGWSIRKDGTAQFGSELQPPTPPGQQPTSHAEGDAE
ncbi:hypothetical protein DYQ93_11560 [Xanthomonas sp. LMG 8992]|uniref:hypothetical protein n=1 Tax=Xanthomonas sp. LMG 8992 TaxID=1591157 RepID=UPI00136B9E08|nr:hypothetical protein [Xanthomonas sp. LMG 8992]MXV11657.1 hypothetical protein [Xanthomonas sp. LMG 8992]